jgi:hypothetical protein
MRSKELGFYSAIVSIAFLAYAGNVALADSEASFQAGSQASSMNNSENGHVGESQSNRESTNQGGTGSQSSAHQENSSEATEETGKIPVTQPGVNRPGTSAVSPASPAGGNAGNNAGGARTKATSASVRPTSPTTAATAHKVPVMKTTTYNWGHHGNAHSRIAARHHTSHTYMVNTIHQAASTR